MYVGAGSFQHSIKEKFGLYDGWGMIWAEITAHFPSFFFRLSFKVTRSAEQRSAFISADLEVLFAL